jgi:hypothetical protein
MSGRRTALRAALLAALVAGLLAGASGGVAADGSDGADGPTVGEAQDRRATATRLAGVAERTLLLAGSGIAVGLGVGLCLGGIGAYGYWTRRFGG